MNDNRIVNAYIEKHQKWSKLLLLLRNILISTDLEETIKWGAPTYTFDGANIVGLVAFKEFVCLWFYQGVYLKDSKKVLQNAQEGKTKALRQWRINTLEGIDEQLVKAYIEEAILNQKEGRFLRPTRGKPITMPDELKVALSRNNKFKNSFEQLTLTKQREFADYILEAKRSETKQKRLEKIIPMVLEQKGLHDQYKK